MRKTIITFFCLSVFFAGKSQFVVNGGDTISITGAADPSPVAEIIDSGSCHNPGTDSLTLMWEIVSDSAVPGWAYTGFCDLNNCYDFFVNEKRAFTLRPHAHGILELHISQGCNAGTGNVKFLLWNAADSAGSVQLVTFMVTVTAGAVCPAGIAETPAEQFLLYPNPVKDRLNITLPQPVSNGAITIFNLLGSKVFSQPVNGNEIRQNLNLSELEAGFYMAVITEQGKFIAARKFNKED